MSDPEERCSPLPIAPLIEPQWTVERREQGLRGVHERLARRKRGARAAAILCVVATLGLVLGFFGHARLVRSPAVAARDGRQVTFADGSSVQLLDASSELVVGATSPGAAEVSLRSGSAEFEITPNPERQFIVHAGEAEVRVLGTHFIVTRAAPRVKVEVTRGRVEVRFSGGSRQLIAGESNWFPPDPALEIRNPVPDAAQDAPHDAVGASASSDPASVADVAPSASGSAPEVSPRHRFLDSAARGQYAQAYSVLERTPEVIGSSAEDLMLAADSARYSGHPQQATRFLERMTREHAQDSVAPLAAFTLGRIYLSQLGQPAKAADAFALSRRLAPTGSLAEDALAREAEAAERSGQNARARGLAEEYARRYPSGRRLESVRKSVGLGSSP
jgi:transmembrane sensor